MRNKNMLFKDFFRSTLDFLIPCRCLMCGDFTQASSTSLENITQPSLCTACWQQLSFITEPYCKACASPLSFDGDGCRSCHEKSFVFDSARAALVYNDAAKQLITRFKHAGQTGYAQLFRPWMQTAIETEQHYDGIIPVPLHFWRLFERGYNQAALLAHRFSLKRTFSSDVAPIPILKGALKRIRHTPSQGHLSAQERLENIDNALNANPAIVSGKCLLLVDDVMTTGATLNECARALKNAGAVRVDVLVLARAVKSV
ncbi:MAG: ComF family protein [Pseudomonadota bacterium]